MKSIKASLIVGSLIIIVACNKSDDKKPSAAPTPATIETLSDKDGNCTDAAVTSFVVATEAISAYDKEQSAEKLKTANSSCEKLQSLIGENSCKMKNAEPQMTLDKNVLGQSCSSIKAKVQLASEEAAKPEIAIEKIVDAQFRSTKNVSVNSNVKSSNSLELAFKSGKKNDLGVAFEANVTCGFYDEPKSMTNSKSSQTSYNGEITVIKGNGDVVRLCGSEKAEVKVGEKTKNGFSFKMAYCVGANKVESNATVEVKVLSEDSISVDYIETGKDKLKCSGVLDKTSAE